MKNHIIQIYNQRFHILEIEPGDSEKPAPGGMQIWGQADTPTKFVKELNYHQMWAPYGYVLRIIEKIEETNYFIAHLYKMGQKFIQR